MIGLQHRHSALQPLSTEHLEALVLCDRIATGLQKEISPNRIKKYADWVKKCYLDPHFELERQFIFPILGNGNFRIKRALANHRRMDRLFQESHNIKVLHKIEEELSSYIRFEERILYNEIQKVARPDELSAIAVIHGLSPDIEDNWKDKFWLA